MNTILDDVLVGMVLLASVGYAAYKLGPRSLRKRILGLLGRAMAAAPSFLRLNAAAQRVAAAAGQPQGACGGCDNCGTGVSQPQSRSAEVTIPVSKIGRRA